MSKFIDKLNRLFQGETQPIGFRAREPVSPKPKIQLVASLAQENAEGLTDHVVGADAGLLRIAKPSTGTEALQKMSQALPDIPWGGWLQGRGLGGIKQLTKAGCDFIVFPATDTPLALIENKETGRILEVEASLTEGLLRTTNELPVDAVLVAGGQREGHSLTWQHLMLFQRFADLLTKPLLVPIPVKVTGDELQALWEAGVSGVVIEVSPEQPQDSLKKLRQVIDKLELPTVRRRGKAEALLPRLRGETSIAPPETEEEEEE
jgi:hypothetical protein